MAVRRPKQPKTVYMTNRDAKIVSGRATANVGIKRRVAGAVGVGYGLSMAFRNRPGSKASNIGFGVAAAGGLSYASGKYSQIKARRRVHRALQQNGMKVHVLGVTKSGNAKVRTVSFRVNDAKANQQRKQFSQQRQAQRQRQAGYKGGGSTPKTHMTRSQAASVAAKARWGRR